MRYMLDTNICIYLIKNKNQQLINNIIKHSTLDICISSIVYSELMYGILHSKQVERNLLALTLFLKNIEIIDFDSEAAIEYGIIKNELFKKGLPIGPFDCLIAAHAKSLDYILVTNNEKEFKRIDKLNIENWS